MKKSPIILTCILLLAAAGWTVPDKDIKKIVQAVAEYEYGRDQKPLTALSDLVYGSNDSPETLLQIEKAISKVLYTRSTAAGQLFMCKQLSLFGTEKSVPVLTKMMKNPETAEYARYALERIPGKKADKALLNLAKKTGGRTQIGVINSLGQRGQTGAANLLKKLLTAETKTAAAAAAALGEIASPECADILEDAAGTARTGMAGPIQNAMIKCADHLSARGEKDIAGRLYKNLLLSGISLPVRAAAFRGTAKCAADQGVMLIKMELQKENSDLKQTAISVVRELGPALDLSGIYADLPALKPAEQIQLLLVAADKKDKDAQQIVRQAVKHKDVNVRIAALEALKSVGGKGDIELLVSAAVTGGREEKEAARSSLYLLSGENIDAAILQATAEADAGQKAEYIKSIGERQISAGIDILVSSAKDQSSKVRSAAFKALGQVAPHEKLGDLVDILAGLEKSSEQKAMGKAIVAVAKKDPNPNTRAGAILQRMEDMENKAVYGELLESLGRIEDKNALPVLRAALDKDGEIKSSAIRALSNWHTAGPMTDLLSIAETAEDEKHRILALRGFIGLVEKTKDGKKVELYKKAMEMATQTTEKRSVFAGLANVHTLDAFNMSAEYINSDDLAQEAGIAAIGIGRRIRNDHSGRVAAVMQEIVKESLNERVRNEAQRLLNTLKLE